MTYRYRLKRPNKEKQVAKDTVSPADQDPPGKLKNPRLDKRYRVSRKGMGGRPTDYRPEYAKMAERLLRLKALTMDELAQVFDTTGPTIWAWRIRHPEFASAVKLGREAADDRVQETLYHRAIGYTYVTKEPKVIRGELTYIEVTHHHPPDVASMIFWMCNRRPDLWRHVSKVEMTGAGGGPIQTTELELNPEMLKLLSGDELKIAERLFKKLTGQKPDANGKGPDPKAADAGAYIKTLH